MLGKAALLVGLAAGYVLGARDGRGRYEQLKTQANRVLQDPRVQQKATQATDLAREKAPDLKDRLASATSKATSTVSGSGSTGGPSTSGSGTSGTTTSGTTTTGTTTTGTGSSGTGPVGAGDVVDDDAIIVTPPLAGPLDPAPTSTDQESGGLHG
jgi:hypothetical protein